MPSSTEHEFTCPYCWETISMVLDLSAEDQHFIEDCEVCCHPIDVSYTVVEEELSGFTALKAQ